MAYDVAVRPVHEYVLIARSSVLSETDFTFIRDTFPQLPENCRQITAQESDETDMWGKIIIGDVNTEQASRADAAYMFEYNKSGRPIGLRRYTVIAWEDLHTPKNVNTRKQSHLLVEQS